MSGRRELLRHIGRLTEIGDLLGAMRSLALAESRRIAGFIDAQRETSAIVRAAYGRLLRDHGERLELPAPAGRVVCVIGSERGFCGDLNQRLIGSAQALIAPHDVASAIATDTPAPRVVLVGSRLADAWSGDAAAAMAGAGFADEVQNILADLVATLTPLMLGNPALSLLYLTDAGPVHQNLLPAPQPRVRATRRSHPLQINLPPRQLHAALIDQFLESALGCALYDALLHENQLRLEHMEQARQRIDEQLEDLARRSNRARQEEITEEIEIILLSSIAAESA